MARPQRCRKVCTEPDYILFSPMYTILQEARLQTQLLTESHLLYAAEITEYARAVRKSAVMIAENSDVQKNQRI